MLNKMMNIINNLEEMSLEQILETNYFTKENINELGFILIRNSELLGNYGIMVSGLLFLTLDGIDNYVPAIVMDSVFDELSDNAKRFIIGHELGHYAYHESKVTTPGYVRDINDEFEADEYSANIIGYQSAIFAAEELQEKLDEVSFGLNKAGVEEMEERINNLLNKANMVTC